MLDMVEVDYGSSTRQIANTLNLHKSKYGTVWKILKDNLLYPYHIRHVRALLLTDIPNITSHCSIPDKRFFLPMQTVYPEM